MADKNKFKKIVVIYHGNCPDGFGAAWAAWKKFGRRASYIGVEHHNPVLTGLSGKAIYLLDFVYPKNVMAELLKLNPRVTAIDHHISAEKITKMTQDWRYDINHSGAVLSWLYFHPGKRVPMLLRCVEDGDLYKWSVSKSKEILALVNLSGRDFYIWNKLARDLENKEKRKDFAEKGRALVAHDEALVKKLASLAEKVKFAGMVIYAVNAPRYFADDLGHILSGKLPPAAIVWREEGGYMRVSLRSNGAVDVAKIAAEFGGGGHKRASSFSFPFGKKFPWRIIKKK